MLLAAIPTALAMGLDERTLNGVSVWVKPLKFQVSLAVHAFTVAWLMLFLPEHYRQNLITKILAAAIAATGLFEIVYITYQASQAEASHYNLTTPITRLMYSLMGGAAVTMLAATCGIGALILRYGPMHNPVAFAAGLGLVLGSILGASTGIYLGSQPNRWVGGLASDAGGIPLFGWSRTGGDLRVPHFAGLHATQFIPLAAWCIVYRLAEQKRKAAVVAIALCTVAATGGLFVQASLGLPLFPL